MLQMVSFFATQIRGSVRGFTSRFVADEHGQDLIEYALLSGIIAAAIVGVTAGVLSGALSSMAQGIADCIDFKSATTCNV